MRNYSAYAQWMIVILVVLLNNAAISQISLSPNSSFPGNTFGVTITGVNTQFLVGTTTCAQIGSFQVSGNASGPTSFSGTVTIPPGAVPGNYGTTIFQGAGCTGMTWSCNNCFTVNTPIIQNVSPGSGTQGSIVSLNITGLGTAFQPGTTNCAQISGSGGTFDVIGAAASSTQFSGTVSLPCDASPGNYSVTVFEGPGCSGTSWSCNNCFSVSPSGGTSMITPSPSSANAGGATNFSIVGVNTCFVPGTTVCGELSQSPSGASYSFSGSATSATSFLATVDLPCQAIGGTYHVFLYDSGCSGAFEGCTDCFTVIPFSGGSISTNISNAERGRNISLQITGSATCFEPGITDRVRLVNGATTYNLTGTANNATDFQADPFDMPCDAPLGAYDIELPMEGALGGLTWICSACLDVVDPANPISFVSGSVLRGATQNVDINGVCTDFMVAGGTTSCAEINLGGNTYAITGSASSTTAFSGTLNVPSDAPSGSYNAVIYQGPGCTGTSWNCVGCFNVLDSLTLTPSSGLRGSDVNVVVTGTDTNFDPANTTCLEIFDGTNTYTVTGTASDASNFSGLLSIPAAASSGSYHAIIYQGPGCGSNSWSCTNCFTVADSISVDPPSEDPGNTVAMTITGDDTSFIPGTTDCVEVTNGAVTYTVSGTAASADIFSGDLALPVDAPFGSYDVIIYQGSGCSGQSWTCTDCFEVSGAPLPVGWLYVQAAQQSDEIVLDWATASERNSDEFVVEHSRTGHHWTAIGKVQAAGLSNHAIEYRFVDSRPLQGDNYYRIKQVDFDGRFEISEVIVVPFQNKGFSFNLMPNPVEHLATLNFNVSERRNIHVRLMNVAGQLLWLKEQQFDKGVYNMPIDMQGFAKGIYILSVKSGDNLQIQKIVKL